jgi:hypothetical protein
MLSKTDHRDMDKEVLSFCLLQSQKQKSQGLEIHGLLVCPPPCTAEGKAKRAPWVPAAIQEPQLPVPSTKLGRQDSIGGVEAGCRTGEFEKNDTVSSQHKEATRSSLLLPGFLGLNATSSHLISTFCRGTGQAMSRGGQAWKGREMHSLQDG